MTPKSFCKKILKLSHVYILSSFFTVISIKLLEGKKSLCLQVHLSSLPTLHTHLPQIFTIVFLSKVLFFFLNLNFIMSTSGLEKLSPRNTRSEKIFRRNSVLTLSEKAGYCGKQNNTYIKSNQQRVANITQDCSLGVSILFHTCWIQIFLQFKQDGVSTTRIHSHCISLVGIQLHHI